MLLEQLKSLKIGDVCVLDNTFGETDLTTKNFLRVYELKVTANSNDNYTMFVEVVGDDIGRTWSVSKIPDNSRLKKLTLKSPEFTSDDLKKLKVGDKIIFEIDGREENCVVDKEWDKNNEHVNASGRTWYTVPGKWRYDEIKNIRLAPVVPKVFGLDDLNKLEIGDNVKLKFIGNRECKVIRKDKDSVRIAPIDNLAGFYSFDTKPEGYRAEQICEIEFVSKAEIVAPKQFTLDDLRKLNVGDIVKLKFTKTDNNFVVAKKTDTEYRFEQVDATYNYYLIDHDKVEGYRHQFIKDIEVVSKADAKTESSDVVITLEQIKNLKKGDEAVWINVYGGARHKAVFNEYDPITQKYWFDVEDYGRWWIRADENNQDRKYIHNLKKVNTEVKTESTEMTWDKLSKMKVGDKLYYDNGYLKGEVVISKISPTYIYCDKAGDNYKNWLGFSPSSTDTNKLTVVNEPTKPSEERITWEAMSKMKVGDKLIYKNGTTAYKMIVSIITPTKISCDVKYPGDIEYRKNLYSFNSGSMEFRDVGYSILRDNSVKSDILTHKDLLELPVGAKILFTGESLNLVVTKKCNGTASSGRPYVELSEIGWVFAVSGYLANGHYKAYEEPIADEVEEDDKTTTEPLDPDELEDSELDIPGEIFEVINDFIKQYWGSNHSIVDWNEVAEKIADKMDINESDVYDKGYLDIEEQYRDVGWKVILHSDNGIAPKNRCWEFRKDD